MSLDLIKEFLDIGFGIESSHSYCPRYKKVFESESNSLLCMTGIIVSVSYSQIARWTGENGEAGWGVGGGGGR